MIRLQLFFAACAMFFFGRVTSAQEIPAFSRDQLKESWKIFRLNHPDQNLLCGGSREELASKKLEDKTLAPELGGVDFAHGLIFACAINAHPPNRIFQKGIFEFFNDQLYSVMIEVPPSNPDHDFAGYVVQFANKYGDPILCGGSAPAQCIWKDNDRDHVSAFLFLEKTRISVGLTDMSAEAKIRKLEKGALLKPEESDWQYGVVPSKSQADDMVAHGWTLVGQIPGLEGSTYLVKRPAPSPKIF